MAVAAGATGRASLSLFIAAAVIGITWGLPHQHANAHTADDWSWDSPMLDTIARTARALRVTPTANSNAATNQPGNNYSVSFVPLFSLIANFIPKLLTRFGIKQGSRSLDEAVDITNAHLPGNSILCRPESTGRWKDVNNCQSFYECAIRAAASTECKQLQEGKVPPHKRGRVVEGRHENKDTLVPVEVDHYYSACMKVTHYKCPSNSMYDDTIQRCTAKNQTNDCQS